jgi:hypothetical protein
MKEGKAFGRDVKRQKREITDSVSYFLKQRGAQQTYGLLDSFRQVSPIVSTGFLTLTSAIVYLALVRSNTIEAELALDPAHQPDPKTAVARDTHTPLVWCSLIVAGVGLGYTFADMVSPDFFRQRRAMSNAYAILCMLSPAFTVFVSFLGIDGMKRYGDSFDRQGQSQAFVPLASVWSYFSTGVGATMLVLWVWDMIRGDPAVKREMENRMNLKKHEYERAKKLGLTHLTTEEIKRVLRSPVSQVKGEPAAAVPADAVPAAAVPADAVPADAVPAAAVAPVDSVAGISAECNDDLDCKNIYSLCNQNGNCTAPFQSPDLIDIRHKDLLSNITPNQAKLQISNIGRKEVSDSRNIRHRIAMKRVALGATPPLPPRPQVPTTGPAESVKTLPSLNDAVGDSTRSPVSEGLSSVGGQWPPPRHSEEPTSEGLSSSFFQTETNTSSGEVPRETLEQQRARMAMEDFAFYE